MRLSNMAAVLREYGLTVVENPGWANRGYAGQDLQDVRGVLWHHTATNPDAFNGSDAPTLNMCVNGRSDLPGPLCNIVFGRTGIVYLTAAGVANHAGRGVAANIPENMGNHYLIGIEMESSGLPPWDWTDDQLRVAPHLGAALEQAYLMHLPPELRGQIGHAEYSYDGKIDPAGWPGGMDGLRGSINALLNGTPATAPPPPAPPKRQLLIPDLPDLYVQGSTTMAMNQEKLDKIYDTILVLQTIAKQGSMDALNYKVKDAAGNDQSLYDLVRSVGGTHYDVPWYGFDGKPQPEGARRSTRIATDVGFNDARAAGLARDVATLRETVKAMAVATGVTIDYDEIARKVADEQDRRDRERLNTTPKEATT